MRGLSDYYLSIMARRLGVPPMFVDDAIQEARIALWLAPDAPERTVAKRRMIDFVRVYGERGRDGQRPKMVGLFDEARYDHNGFVENAELDRPIAHDPYAVVDMVLDFRTAWARLVPTQRRVLLERANSEYEGHAGHGWTNGHQVRVSRARLRLRKLVA